MILTYNEILKSIKKKIIIITPFSKKNIGPASYDITLDNKFRIFKDEYKQIDLNKSIDYKKYTKPITANKIRLNPQEFILGITKEKIKLPNNICGHISGRSMFARFGISVHITADFIQPGINNKQVLEIYNASNKKIILHSGTKIGQIVFEECKGSAAYNGKYKNQNL